MPYHFLDDIALADIAFKAQGKTLEEMFIAAADATMNVMVEDLNSIARQELRTISIEDKLLDMLLFKFLQELIYYKDAQELLLRVPEITIKEKGTWFLLCAQAVGEKIDPKKHELITDIKAVTLHRFKVIKTSQGWEATVILDV